MNSIEEVSMIPTDYHIHTNFSCDSKAPMTEMCRAAIEFGIPEIGLNEHFDLNPDDPCYDFFQIDAWWEELQRCREAFRGSLIIRAGIELGEPHIYQEATHNLFESYPWDYSLASLHWIGTENVLDQSFFEKPEETAYKKYFRELFMMVIQAEFDILAHLDLVKRYGFDIYGSYSPRPYEAEIRAVLRALVERDLALEVNAFTLRRSVNQSSPSEEILAWFIEEGGRWVTIGSDAHQPEEVGFGLDQVMDSLQSVGFNHLSCFEARQQRPFPFPDLEHTA